MSVSESKRCCTASCTPSQPETIAYLVSSAPSSQRQKSRTLVRNHASYLAYALHEGSVAISSPHLLVNVPPIVLV